MSSTILKGLRSGLFASLVLSALFFTYYGPGNLLLRPARWLALDFSGQGRLIGFLIFLILGGLFGMLFGVLQGKREETIGRSLLLGALIGLLYWVIVPILVGTIINHGLFDLGNFLYSFFPILLYGVLLGAFYHQGVAGVKQTQGI